MWGWKAACSGHAAAMPHGHHHCCNLKQSAAEKQESGYPEPLGRILALTRSAHMTGVYAPPQLTSNPRSLASLTLPCLTPPLPRPAGLCQPAAPGGLAGHAAHPGAAAGQGGRGGCGRRAGLDAAYAGSAGGQATGEEVGEGEG